MRLLQQTGVDLLLATGLSVGLVWGTALLGAIL